MLSHWPLSLSDAKEMASQFAAIQSPPSERSFINLMTSNRRFQPFILQKLSRPTSVLPGYTPLSLMQLLESEPRAQACWARALLLSSIPSPGVASDRKRPPCLFSQFWPVPPPPKCSALQEPVPSDRWPPRPWQASVVTAAWSSGVNTGQCRLASLSPGPLQRRCPEALDRQGTILCI